METIILALGKYLPLKMAALPAVLTSATWLILRIRPIIAVSAVICGILRQ